jgi:hypothetical protein
MDIFFLLRVHVAHLKIIKLSLNQLGNNKKKKLNTNTKISFNLGYRKSTFKSMQVILMFFKNEKKRKKPMNISFKRF